MNRSKKRIIYNITKQCPYSCKFCVMDAGPKCRSEELTLGDKIKICENIDIPNVQIDLSGGEVMLRKADSNEIIDLLSKKFGKENVGISSSGFGIDSEEAAFLASRVNDVEMTMDSVPEYHYEYRQMLYHANAAMATENLKKKDVKVGIQTVLTRVHYENPDILWDLYGWLRKHEVDEWSLIRYFPSGRGEQYANLELTDKENEELVNYIKSLCDKNQKLKLDIHYLLPGSPKSHQCRCVKHSIGILPNGDVTACFWGLDGTGNIKDSKFYLGNLLEQKLSEILNGPNAVYWENYCGKCPLSEEDE